MAVHNRHTGSPFIARSRSPGIVVVYRQAARGPQLPVKTKPALSEENVVDWTRLLARLFLLWRSFAIAWLMAAAPAIAADTPEHRDNKHIFVATYVLIMNSMTSREQFNAVCELRDDAVAIVDGKPWGKWEASSKNSLLVHPSSQKCGVAKLRRLPSGELLGQELRDTTVIRWRLSPIYVHSRWVHQAGNQPPQELVFWSTGRVGTPDGRIKWFLTPKTRELIMEWPESTDRCTLSTDGNRYEGRNQFGTLITGKRILNPNEPPPE